MNNINLQPTLSNDFVKIAPLSILDFESLFNIASDPLIWEQHPNPDRYKKPVFETYFKGAIESKSAFLVRNKQTDEIIGCSRFYDLDKKNNTIAIGYTFISRNHWGGSFNKALKSIMLNHAFQFVDSVHFHIGANNIRSQTSIQRLGAKKIDEVEISYYGEAAKLNFVYQISKEDWESKNLF